MPWRRSFSRSIRSIVWSDIDGSNRAWRLAGSDFARTIAISASRSISSGVARPGRPSEIPIEALMNHSRAAHRERRPQVRSDPLGDGARLVGARDLVEQDAELVAAEAGDRVARSQAGDQALADGHQQPVADASGRRSR